MVRLASVQHNGMTKLVAQLSSEKGGGYCDLTSIASNVREFFIVEGLIQANELIAQTSLSSSSNYISADDCHLLAPIDGSLVGKFLCIGMNYKDHCTEQDVEIPTEPLVFSKFASDCIVGPGDAVAKDEHTEKLDYEVELGVVIGASVPRYTSKEDVHKYVGGFTVIHDVSARYVLYSTLLYSIFDRINLS